MRPALCHHVPRGVSGAKQRKQRKDAHVPAGSAGKAGLSHVTSEGKAGLLRLCLLISEVVYTCMWGPCYTGSVETSLLAITSHVSVFKTKFVACNGVLTPCLAHIVER
jgi:hypothetical protein